MSTLAGISSVHQAFILVHASAAVLALLLGLIAIRRAAAAGPHALATAVMTLSLAGAVVVGLPGYRGALVVVFPGLLVLAGCATCRSFSAWRGRPGPGASPPGEYVSSLGFTIITLAAGFLAILALRAGLGPVGIALGVIVPIVLGRLLLARLSGAVLAAPARPRG